jgi:4-carboxymuconolactone decarboxylase
VRYKSSLAPIEEKLLPAISAAAAAGHGPKLRGYIRRALSEGVPMRHIEEVILQCYLFAGFPAALEGLVVLREATAGRRRRPRVPSTPIGEIINRGLRLCRRVYGDKYEPLRRRSLELHPEMWSWMIREGYGKVLSRPPLSPAMRELCVIATLVVTGWARQLRSHLHGALNVGCSPESVMGAVRAAGRVAGPECYGWARQIARSPRRPGSGAAGGPGRRRARVRPAGASRASRVE